MNEITLTKDSARRIANAVRKVERMTPGTSPDRTHPRPLYASFFAVVSVAITAGNQTAKTLGSGKGTLQLIKATTSGGTTTYSYAAWPGLADVVILNGGATIAVGRLIQVKMIDGFFVVDVDYC